MCRELCTSNPRGGESGGASTPSHFKVGGAEPSTLDGVYLQRVCNSTAQLHPELTSSSVFTVFYLGRLGIASRYPFNLEGIWVDRFTMVYARTRIRKILLLLRLSVLMINTEIWI